MKTLSDNIEIGMIQLVDHNRGKGYSCEWLKVEKVKEFIKELKSQLLTKGKKPTRKRIKEIIENLAGDELLK